MTIKIQVLKILQTDIYRLWTTADVMKGCRLRRHQVSNAFTANPDVFIRVRVGQYKLVEKYRVQVSDKAFRGYAVRPSVHSNNSDQLAQSKGER